MYSGRRFKPVRSGGYSDHEWPLRKVIVGAITLIAFLSWLRHVKQPPLSDVHLESYDRLSPRALDTMEGGGRLHPPGSFQHSPVGEVKPYGRLESSGTSESKSFRPLEMNMFSPRAEDALPFLPPMPPLLSDVDSESVGRQLAVDMNTPGVSHHRDSEDNLRSEISPSKRIPSTKIRGKVPVVVQEVLVSAGKPASSDVRGNLGPATVVTSNIVKDWLKDRWQAAKNMQGVPIPGPHWIEVDLEQRCICSRFLVDFETAFAKVP